MQSGFREVRRQIQENCSLGHTGLHNNKAERKAFGMDSREQEAEAEAGAAESFYRI